MTRFHEQIHGVYFDDLDPYGILHNARYLLLFERTLGSFWAHMGLQGFQDSPDRFHFVRANAVDYLRPVRGTGSVRVRVWIQQLGRSSLTFGFKLMRMDEDSELATGSRVVVRVDPDTWRPTPWTEAFREVLTPWLPEVA
ncbi:MAG: acyl-CoA thioesterase [Myxococcales bacterium]|nr:acyl-CoA thioesterase [Myxococcales bacterium]MCB9664088.1 acyl-CoA thioesterase [Alphaproteobacteria bacterium]